MISTRATIIDGSAIDWRIIQPAYIDGAKDEDSSTDFEGTDLERCYPAKDRQYLHATVAVHVGSPANAIHFFVAGQRQTGDPAGGYESNVASTSAGWYQLTGIKDSDSTCYGDNGEAYPSSHVGIVMVPAYRTRYRRGSEEGQNVDIIIPRHIHDMMEARMRHLQTVLFVMALIILMPCNARAADVVSAAPTQALAAVDFPRGVSPRAIEISVGACDKVLIQPKLNVPSVDVGKTAALIMYLYFPQMNFGIHVPSRNKTLATETIIDLLSAEVDFSELAGMNFVVYYGYSLGSVVKYNAYSVVVGSTCGNEVPNNDYELEVLKAEQLALLERGFDLPAPYGFDVRNMLPVSSLTVEQNIDILDLHNSLTVKNDWRFIPDVSLIEDIQPVDASWRDIIRFEVPEDPDLLIICHEDFLEALEPLKQHKNATGMPTVTISWQKIVTQFNGRDDAERIKKAIAYYVKTLNLQYVMLVGDVDKLPVRYCKVYDNVNWGDRWQSSDLYYADIYKDGNFASWDDNGNDLFGEIVSAESGSPTRRINIDNIEADIDIPVGRIPASSLDEVINYAHKVIQYENGGYQNYMDKALFLVPGNDKGNDAYPNSTLLKEHVADLFSDGQIAVTKQYHDLSSQEISNAINNGVGFVNFAGHGAFWGWDIGYNSTDNLWSSFNRNHIISLANQNKFPIVFSVACSTGRYIFGEKFRARNGEDFDLSVTCLYNPELEIQGCLPAPQANPLARYMPEPAAMQPAEYDIDSMAEYFLQSRTEMGAVAFIGSTDATQGPAQDIDEYFSYIYSLGMSLRRGDTSIVQPTLGGFWRYTINQYGRNHVDMNALESSDWFKAAALAHVLKYHLFGDPSLRIGGLR